MMGLDSIFWEYRGIKNINKITGLSRSHPSFWEVLGLLL